MTRKTYERNYNEEKKKFVKEYLRENCLGRCNAIHYKQSKELLGLASRQMAHIITELRFEGYPVCSHNIDGIWWAKDKDELLTTLRFLNSRISVLNSNVDGLNKALENFDLY